MPIDPPTDLPALVRDIVLIGLGVVSLGPSVYWGVVLSHVIRTARRVPTARDGLRLDEARTLPDSTKAPKVCVVVPAHNEAECIQTVARSLKDQDYPALGVVFSLDRCTDTTRSLLDQVVSGDPRFDIREVTQCPPGWAGKVHAIYDAVSGSALAKQADVLLFVDADTTLDPACVRACTALLVHRRLGMLSLMSTLTSAQWFERVVQPAAGLELARQYPLERAAATAQSRRAFANGQFIMMTRAAYDQIGTHEAVRHAVLEDLEIARLCQTHDVPVMVSLADGMLVCRMYAGYAEFTRGWKRIFTESCNRRVARLHGNAQRTRMLGVVLPATGLVSAVLGAVFLRTGHEPAVFALASGALGIVIMLVALMTAFKLGRIPVLSALVYPIGAWITGSILHAAARDLKKNRPTVWGGREYQREAR